MSNKMTDLNLKERKSMKTTFILCGFLSIIIILILIFFKIYYIELSAIFELVNSLFFGFLRVIFSVALFIFMYISLANYLEYKKQVLEWKGTIFLFIFLGFFVYFMFDFPNAPTEMILSLLCSAFFVFYLYLIQD
ncbi:MAG: hypothetical protein ACTSPY_02670 [Candidatus Helarchaeota archaeon]